MSIEQIQRGLKSYLSEFGTKASLFENLGRTPLHGISTDIKVYNLIINGQVPDYVIVSHVRMGNRFFGIDGEETTVYFWYFSDFQFEPGDEIIITFGEE